MALAHKQQTAPWCRLDELDAERIDNGLRELIVEAGSLTRTLRRRCNGAFRLRLLGEHKTTDGAASVREVVMLCDRTPWVFAQTVMPEETLASNAWLRGLGEQPLGDTLFERPGVERSGLQFRSLVAGEVLFDRAVTRTGLTAPPASLWARRSVIMLGSHRLTVNEVFLPGAGRCQAD